MNIIMIIYTIILFVLLTPSVLFRFPKKGKKLTVAFVHGIIFAIIYYFTHTLFRNIVHKEQFKLYGDSKCNNDNIIASPEKTIQKGTSNGVYFNDINNNCVGPFTFADKNMASSAEETGTASTMAPATGTMAPATGTMAPATGTMAPATGTMAPSTATMAPATGTMARGTAARGTTA
jgi:hypothetical protein